MKKRLFNRDKGDGGDNKNIFYLFIALILIVHPSVPLYANDGAAEIALGGIRLKQERRIVMAKESLHISKKKVRVQYEFINESDENVTTEIAFPIPDYWVTHARNIPYFNDFKALVNGVQIKYHTQASAWLKDTDVSKTLDKLKISIPNFGNWGNSNQKSQLHMLSSHELNILHKDGLIWDTHKNDECGLQPKWTVKKTYHWTQTFPAKTTTHIQHEYSPEIGFSNLTIEEIENPSHHKNTNNNAESGCPDRALKSVLEKALKNRFKNDPSTMNWPGKLFFTDWVRYILTTATTWKTPIHDFELIIEREPGEFTTFCWDGPVEKIGPNTFRARINQFIPKKELTVYFIRP